MRETFVVPGPGLSPCTDHAELVTGVVPFAVAHRTAQACPRCSSWGSVADETTDAH